MTKLIGLPSEVLEKMLDYQVMQGNPRDVSVFDENIAANLNGKGFDWKETKEGYNFWNSVINFMNFDLFFKMYPKKPYPKVMLVNNHNNKNGAKKKVVIMYKKGKYIAWKHGYSIEDVKNSTTLFTWNYAWDIEEEPMIELTLEDIAKLKGVDVNRIRIKN